MLPKRIVFLGSKPIGYECLSFLIAQKNLLNIEIVAVLTHARKEFGNAHDLTELAIAHQIPVLHSLDDLPKCDIIYSVQYNKLLKQEHIEKASTIAVNLHMAPLPEYRGANQFSFAIIDEKSEFGTTIHQIDSRIDHGDIMFQKRFPIPENCWVDDLYKLTYEASIKLFRQTLKHVIDGSYSLLPQELLIPKYGTNLHYKKEMNDLKIIDLNWGEEKRLRYIRATSMPGFEPPYAIVNGDKVYFTKNGQV